MAAGTGKDCNNLRDEEDKEVISFALPGPGRRFRPVTTIMTAEEGEMKKIVAATLLVLAMAPLQTFAMTTLPIAVGDSVDRVYRKLGLPVSIEVKDATAIKEGRKWHVVITKQLNYVIGECDDRQVFKIMVNDQGEVFQIEWGGPAPDNCRPGRGRSFREKGEPTRP